MRAPTGGARLRVRALTGASTDGCENLRQREQAPTPTPTGANAAKADGSERPRERELRDGAPTEATEWRGGRAPTGARTYAEGSKRLREGRAHGWRAHSRVAASADGRTCASGCDRADGRCCAFGCDNLLRRERPPPGETRPRASSATRKRKADSDTRASTRGWSAHRQVRPPPTRRVRRSSH